MIHTNFCHVSVFFIKRYKDFIIFIDEIIRMSFVYFLSNKKSTIILEIFERFKEHVELHFHLKGYKIKLIRMNDEFEYQVTFKDFLIEKKIENDIIIHYFSEFNRISECLNRILLDIIHIILFDANLSNKL